MTMDELTLRAWVRGTLSPARRREVTAWMLRCTDPDLPILIHGLIREQEQEQSDAALLARAPDAGWLVDAWHRLLELGAATWETLASDEPQLAVLAAGSTNGPVFAVIEEGDGVARFRIRPGLVGQFVLVVTNDRLEEELLLPPTRSSELSEDRIPGWQVQEGDGRTTFWFAVGDAPPSELRELVQASASGDVQLHAVRLDS